MIRYRKLNRLSSYDYSRVGAYFITLCVQNRECRLGTVRKNRVVLSEVGQIAENYWIQIPNHFPTVELGEFIIMPNHVHGIIIVNRLLGNVATNVNNVIVGDANVGDGNVGDGNVGDAYMRPLQSKPPNNDYSQQNADRTKMLIPKIVQQYKAAVSRTYRKTNCKDYFCWQRSYYDHIIRDQISFERIGYYIRVNPLKWSADIENTSLSEDIADEHYNQLFD